MTQLGLITVVGLIVGSLGVTTLILHGYDRGWHDELLFRARCFGAFHRPTRRQIPHPEPYQHDMACTRCGTTWESRPSW